MTSWQGTLLSWHPAALLSLVPTRARNGPVNQEWTHYQPSSLAKEVVEGEMSTFREKCSNLKTGALGCPLEVPAALSLLEDWAPRLSGENIYVCKMYHTPNLYMCPLQLSNKSP